MSRPYLAALVVGLTLGLLQTPSHVAAQSAPSEKCIAAKIRCLKDEVAGLLACREKCGKNPKLCGATQASCEAKIVARLGTGGAAGDGCLDKLAAKAVCPPITDAAALDAQARAAVAALIERIEGTPTPTCGDGLVEGAEHCDLGNLGGKTCASEGLFGQGLACAPGCVLDTSACAPQRFEDTGATVIDHQTGLQWEKKTDDGGIHDKDNRYTWTSGVANDGSGTAFTRFLWGPGNGLNYHVGSSFFGFTRQGCFAGRCDWRIPTVDELNGITDLALESCLDPVFGSPIPSSWSATTPTFNPFTSWVVSFDFCGEGVNTGKTAEHPVLAVRGPS